MSRSHNFPDLGGDGTKKNNSFLPSSMVRSVVHEFPIKPILVF